jgi:DNA-binding beta-propeller fold protein YncE
MYKNPCIWCITFCFYQSVFYYHYDKSDGRIVCLDSTGVLKWIYAGNPYNARKLFHPYDMVTTSDGNVYMVCSAKENAIHVLNHEGEIIKYQQSIDLGIYRPFNVTMSYR